MTLAMLLGGGLLIRSAVLESRVVPGFSHEGLVSAQLSLPRAKYSSRDSLVSAYALLLEEVRTLPGVESAGLGNRVPLAGPSLGIEYAPRENPSEGVLAALRIASPGIFETLEVPLIRGRSLADRDGPQQPLQVVVNQTFARTVWGSEDPIGRHLVSENRSFQDASGEPLDLEVVGVVGDIRSNGLRSAVPGEVYVSMEQSPPDPWYWAGNSMMLVVRSSIDADSLVPELRRAVAAFDPSLPLFNVSTMNGRLSRAAAVARFNTWLFSLLGAAALVLACAGIYSLTAFVVSQQEYEMGVRLALGSTAEQLVRRIVLRSMIPVVGGVAVGLLLAAALSGLVRAELFGVDQLDPIVCLLGAGLLLAAGLAAAFVPARRTSRIDPARVLGVQ